MPKIIGSRPPPFQRAWLYTMALTLLFAPSLSSKLVQMKVKNVRQIECGQNKNAAFYRQTTPYQQAENPWLEPFHLTHSLEESFVVERRRASEQINSSTENEGLTSFGIMFDIRALKPLVITSIAFKTELTRDVDVKVYTKTGTYLSFEDKPSEWTLISEAKVLGQGLEGLTSIPPENFEPVRVGADFFQAFYLSLDTPDLQFYSINHEEDDIVASNSDIEFMKGAGVGEQSFGSVFQHFRAFVGYLNYAVVSPTSPPTAPPTFPVTATPTIPVTDSPTAAPTVPISDSPTSSPTGIQLVTDVECLFEIQRDSSINFSDIVPEAVSSIETSVKSILSEGSIQKYFMKVCGRKLSFLYINNKLHDRYCESIFEGGECHSINIIITVGHDICNSPDEVEYFVLEIVKNTAEHVECPYCSMFYVGPTAKSSKLIVTLNGDDLNEMKQGDKTFFEETTLKFLKESTSLSVHEVSVVRQSILSQMKNRRHLSQTRKLIPAANRIEMSVSGVSSSDVNFGEEVQDSINRNGGKLVSKLRENDSFKKVSGVDAKTLSTSNVSPPVTISAKAIERKRKILIIAFGTLAIAGFIASIALLVLKGKENKRRQALQSNIMPLQLRCTPYK